MTLDVIALGAVSALGLDLSAHLSLGASPAPGRVEELRQGVDNVVGRLHLRSAGQLQVRPLLKSPKTAKFLTREMALLLHAAAEAGRDMPAVEPHRVGVVVATAPPLASLADIAGIRDHCVVDGVLQPALLAADLPRLMPATWPFHALKATAGCHLASELGWIGPNLTLSPLPLAGLQIVDVAALLLASGAADIVLAGGADSRIDDVAVIEAVTRRCKRLGVDSLNAAEMEAGMAEGAAILALSRTGTRAGAVARLLAWEEVHLPHRASAVALVRAFQEIVSRFKSAAGVDHFSTLWVDLNLDLNPAGPDFQALVQGAPEFESYIDIRHEIGDPGITASTLALAVACAKVAAGRTGAAVVVSVHDPALCAILVGGAS